MEENILNLGLGFVFTPVYDSFQTKIDMFKLVKQIKLKVL